MTTSIHLVALGAALGTALTLACRPQTAHEDHAHHQHAALPADAPLPDRSIYQLEGAWTDPGGRSVRLAELRGDPVLVLLFYGTCEHACPALVRDLQRIEAGLAPEDRARTRFLLVSFDPERDTPERLAAYAAEKGLESERWLLLHGHPEQIRELALVLGVRYRPSGNGEFSHSMRITLLDRDGVVADSLEGLGQPVEALANAVTALLRDAGPAS